MIKLGGLIWKYTLSCQGDCYRESVSMGVRNAVTNYFQKAFKLRLCSCTFERFASSISFLTSLSGFKGIFYKNKAFLPQLCATEYMIHTTEVIALDRLDFIGFVCV